MTRRIARSLPSVGKLARFSVILLAAGCAGPFSRIRFPSAQRGQYRAVAAGGNRTCAVRWDGNGVCWGVEREGPQDPAGVPSGGAKPTVIAHAGKIVPADGYTCVILTGGELECRRSGAAASGPEASAPLNVPPGITMEAREHVRDVAVGAHHACVVRSGGVVECWGSGGHGTLGDGKTIDSSLPVRVDPLPATAAVVVGARHSCSLSEEGRVSCWGDNSFGQLGRPEHGLFPTAAPVPGLKAIAIAAGRAHTCAILPDRSVQCWGATPSGQAGPGASGPSGSTTPSTVSGLARAKSLALGDDHACALVLDGSVWCWGSNAHGQLGVPGTATPATAVRVAELPTAAYVTAGADHTCALLDDGGIRCWGRNTEGQLGIEGGRDSPVPVMPLPPDGKR